MTFEDFKGLSSPYILHSLFNNLLVILLFWLSAQLKPKNCLQLASV